jgi:hypothetical protein
MNGLLLYNFVEKSCLTGSLVLLCYSHRFKTCGYENKSFQDKLKNENAGSTLDSY